MEIGILEQKRQRFARHVFTPRDILSAKASFLVATPAKVSVNMQTKIKKKQPMTIAEFAEYLVDKDLQKIEKLRKELSKHLSR